MLEETVATYLAVASVVGTPEGVALPTADGLVFDPALMTCLLLGEQLVHGLDIARAAHQPWSIAGDDALLGIPAMLSLAPQYLRSSRTKNLRISSRYARAVAAATGWRSPTAPLLSRRRGRRPIV
jgi:hypothetical protein